MNQALLAATAAVFALSSAGAPAARAEAETSARFKGYVAVNRQLEERVVLEGQGFQLATYLDEFLSTFNGVTFYGNGLVSLLGIYDSSALDSAFRNGEPNVINMLLWHVAFSGLSQDIGALCDPSSGTLFRSLARPTLLEALKPVCDWPAPSARSDDALMGLWLALMSFDAPMSEYQAWRDFFQGPAFASAKASDAVAAMALAAFDNPYFLLSM
jgi:hypothetical protein